MLTADNKGMKRWIIAEWSKRNNLALNWSKSAEIVFSDSRKRRSVEPPPPLSGIARVKSLKVLGVTTSNKLLVSEHVNNVVQCSFAIMSSKSCEHTAYASPLYSKSTSQLLSRNYYTLPLLGGASRRQQIVNEWKRSSAVVRVPDCIHHSRPLTK